MLKKYIAVSLLILLILLMYGCNNPKCSDNNYLIRQAGQFSEGYAWVSLYNDKTDIEKYACINSEGKICFFLDENLKPDYKTDKSNFHNNTSLLSNDTIITTEGQIIFSVDDVYTDVLAYGGGYWAIAKHISNINEDKYLISFMDTNGIFLDYEWDLSLSSISDVNMNYYGESVFAYEDNFFNLNTKLLLKIMLPVK